MRKEKNIIKICTIFILCITLIISTSSPIYAISLFNKKSIDENKDKVEKILAIKDMQSRMNVIRQNNKIKKQEIILTEEEQKAKINGFSKDLVKDIFKNIMKAIREDKLGVRDLALLKSRINAIYNSKEAAKLHNGAVFYDLEDLGFITSVCQCQDNINPITVTPIKVHSKNESHEATLITLGGTEFKEGQATTMDESEAAGNDSLENDYLRAVVKVFNTKDVNGNPVIPKDKPIIITGISLGGMIAQQVLANIGTSETQISPDYKFERVISFGSPLTNLEGRLQPHNGNEYTVFKRICDKADIVPHSSIAVMKNEINKATKGEEAANKSIEALNYEIVEESGGYKSFIVAHALSYVEKNPIETEGYNRCWKDYDILGEVGKENHIEFIGDMVSYEAKKQIKPEEKPEKIDLISIINNLFKKKK